MAKVTAGVDLGGTKIQTVVLSGGKVAGMARELTPQSGANDVVAAISETLRTALSNADLKGTDLSGIGVGSPGQIDDDAGTVSNSPNVHGFEGEPVPLATMLRRKFRGVPVRLENDVRVAVLGEHKRGAGRPYRDLLGVFVGTGVGGGVVLEGKLRRADGAAGEIGHTTVLDGGRQCSCGQKGHLEAYAGRGRIEHEARRLHKKGHETVLFDLMKKKGRTRLSSGVIEEALKSNDRMARRLVDDAVWALGVALASAQNLLAFEAVIIGGGLGDRLGRPFVDRVAAQIAPRLLVPERAPAVLSTELGDLSGAIGAALIAS